MGFRVTAVDGGEGKIAGGEGRVVVGEGSWRNRCWNGRLRAELNVATKFIEI